MDEDRQRKNGCLKDLQAAVKFTKGQTQRKKKQEKGKRLIVKELDEIKEQRN